ncbi:unnamed protein product [Ceutorhynchus assimilis]|uniref:Uncharacterized protein n=1 Tax=Ceutorhynchus assimilis TaxID=467358 RepID=A0A9N9QIN8_9CUCU|nr:unnamed protein product [Ceutorhynchus assimilis]
MNIQNGGIATFEKIVDELDKYSNNATRED